MQLKETQTALRAFGKYVVQQARTNLTKGKKNVSKELYDSIGYTIEEVSQEELSIAGLRINPATNGPSRSSYYTGVKIKSLETLEETAIAGMPQNGRIGYVSWSPNNQYFAFLNTVSNGIELWVVDVENAKARRMTDAGINAAMSGGTFSWFSDGESLILPRESSGKP